MINYDVVVVVEFVICFPEDKMYVTHDRLVFKRIIALRRFSTRQRFYEKALWSENAGNFHIQLDGRLLRTPLKHKLCIPTKQMASIVATEWQSQGNVISAEKMHITALCNTCIDNPKQQSKQQITNEIMAFLHSDTLCARIPSEENEFMANLQKEKWDPLLEWFNERFGVQVLVSTNICAIEQNRNTINKIEHFLSKANIWQLTGLKFAVESLKSLIVPLAVIDEHISIDNAMYLSRLETEAQIQKWGNVAWHHDIDYANQKGKLAAGILFYQLSNELNSNFLA